MVENILTALAHGSVAACLLIPPLLLLRRTLRIPARVQYALWLLVAARLLLPIQIDVPVKAPQSAGVQGRQVRPSIAAGSALPPAEPVEAWTRRTPEGADALRPNAAHIAACLWAAGAAGAAAYMLWLNAGFRRGLRRANVRGLSPEEQGLYIALCEELGVRRPPEVTVFEPLASAGLYGLLRPGIALNLSATQPQNITDVLTHELCHLRQGDPLWASLRGVCLVIYWFHPLVWLGARASMRDGELSCDALAVASRDMQGIVDYGRTLLRLAHAQRRPSSLLQATSMYLRESDVKERIERMLILRKPKRLLTASCMAFMLALTLGSFAAAAPAAVQGAEHPGNLPEEAPPLSQEASPGEPWAGYISASGRMYAPKEIQRSIERARQAVEEYLDLDLDAQCKASWSPGPDDLYQRVVFMAADDLECRVDLDARGILRVQCAFMGEADFWPADEEAYPDTEMWAARWGEAWFHESLSGDGRELGGEAGERVRGIERETHAYLESHGIEHEPWTGWWESNCGILTGGGGQWRRDTDVVIVIRYPNDSGLMLSSALSSIDVGYSLYLKRIVYLAMVHEGNG